MGKKVNPRRKVFFATVVSGASWPKRAGIGSQGWSALVNTHPSIHYGNDDDDFVDDYDDDDDDDGGEVDTL